MAASASILNQTPVMKGYPILGLIPDLAHDLIGTYRSAAALGPVVSMNIGNRQSLLLTDAPSIKHVLLDNHQNYEKGDSMRTITPLLGKGLFLSEGDLWSTQRRILQPGFYRPNLVGLTDIMVEAATETVATWASLPNCDIDLVHQMRRITQNVIVRAMFSNSISPEETTIAGEALDYSLGTLVERTIVPSLPLWLPLPSHRKLQRALDALNAIVYRYIRERRAAIGAGPDPNEDLLAMLLNARYPNCEGMSDEQLRDEVMTLFIAGHETTANTLVWTWVLLSQNPHAKQRLQHELDEVLAGRLPTFADLPSLPYLEWVIKESLRLYPPAWSTARQAIKSDIINGHPVDPGQLIVASFYFLHRNAAYWNEPERFIPERFDPAIAQQRPKAAYMPFGYGPRVCLGEHFAMMEAALALAICAQAYDVEVANEPITPYWLGTLRPAVSPPTQIRPRSLA